LENLLKPLLLFTFALLAAALGLLAFLAWQDLSSTSVLVEWSTASELDTAGFNLYRSEEPEGEFVKVNSSLVPASSDPLVGGSYTYEDAEVRPGRTYYYRLEEVEYDGGTSTFGPISVRAENHITSWLLLGLAPVALILIWLALRPRKTPTNENEGHAGKPDE
jgi:hypothetical protein